MPPQPPRRSVSLLAVPGPSAAASEALGRQGRVTGTRRDSSRSSSDSSGDEYQNPHQPGPQLHRAQFSPPVTRGRKREHTAQPEFSAQDPTTPTPIQKRCNKGRAQNLSGSQAEEQYEETPLHPGYNPQQPEDAMGRRDFAPSFVPQSFVPPRPHSSAEHYSPCSAPIHSLSRAHPQSPFDYPPRAPQSLAFSHSPHAPEQHQQQLLPPVRLTGSTCRSSPEKRGAAETSHHRDSASMPPPPPPRRGAVESMPLVSGEVAPGRARSGLAAFAANAQNEVLNVITPAQTRQQQRPTVFQPARTRVPTTTVPSVCFAAPPHQPPFRHPSGFLPQQQPPGFLPQQALPHLPPFQQPSGILPQQALPHAAPLRPHVEVVETPQDQLTKFLSAFLVAAQSNQASSLPESIKDPAIQRLRSLHISAAITPIFHRIRPAHIGIPSVPVQILEAGWDWSIPLPAITYRQCIAATTSAAPVNDNALAVVEGVIEVRPIKLDLSKQESISPSDFADAYRVFPAMIRRHLRGPDGNFLCYVLYNIRIRHYFQAARANNIFNPAYFQQHLFDEIVSAHNNTIVARLEANITYPQSSSYHHERGRSPRRNSPSRRSHSEALPQRNDSSFRNDNPFRGPSPIRGRGVGDESRDNDRGREGRRPRSPNTTRCILCGKTGHRSLDCKHTPLYLSKNTDGLWARNRLPFCFSFNI
ncbi:hypothetical protein B0H17DRAFT_1125246 [Mycena rosella]|uniref:CCHC-type domain-containing protein n=1 Tax=Mycena rosella TaxID=1033263 RepID=A0AAD7GXF1_MYCRO|nr:hypothetical protein B0H17DRAFT_1125246 [Mycena rosella]